MISPPRPLIAVTGAGGAVGTRLVPRLADRGVRLRLVVRNPVRAPHAVGAEVRQAGGYAAGAEMEAALEGVDVLFLMPAAETPDRVEQHRTAIDAAVAASVEHIVYLSFYRAASDATFTLARDHWHTEQHIRANARSWTFLRMNLYMDFIPTMVNPDGVIRGPAGDGRLAAVLRDDVAAAAAAVLATPDHEGQTYDLTGPEAFTLAEAAAALSRATGMAIRYQEETDEEAFASRASSGAPESEILGWVSSYWAIRDGSLAEPSDDLLRLTGVRPTSLDDWLRTNRGAVEHVAGP